MAEPIGILGGTFDPFHFGHLRLAIECRERLQLQSIRLVPLHTPPHRRDPIASADQRLAMLEMAVRDHDFLQVDDCELRRRGVSYTIDTIRHYRETLTDTPLCLLIGRDAFNALCGWQEWQHLVDYAHIVIVGRPGSDPEQETGNTELAAFVRRYRTVKSNDLHNSVTGKIFELTIPMLDISATRIRDIFATGDNPAGLLPGTIIEYIKTHSLYSKADT